MGWPRLRVFAGPNGSGKSTLKTFLAAPLLGVYINPDEIEHTMRVDGCLDLAAFHVDGHAHRLFSFLKESQLLSQAGLTGSLEQMRLEGHYLHLGRAEVNSYLASVIADFLRQQLLDDGVSFTFETVMSSPDKIELMKRANALGYRVYL